MVIDKADYIKKAEELLNKTTYKKIPEDLTSKQKNKLINILRNIKTEGGLSEEACRRMYPTRAGSPNILWAAKDSQTMYTPKAHSMQHWHSNIQHSQRISKDPETTGGDVYSSCP